MIYDEHGIMLNEGASSLKARDSLRKKEYFEEFIQTEQNRINKFILKMETLNTDRQIGQCKMYIAGFYRNKISAMYSAGYSKNAIRNEVIEYLKYYEFNSDSYNDMVDALSIIILFDIKINPVLRYNSNDTLISILKQYISTGKYSVPENPTLDYNDQYQIYIDLLNGKASYDDFVSFMNNDWYNQMADVYWYDSHKSDTNTYTGYWCWIGAAICKILNVPKSILNKCKFVPKDVV